MRLHSRQHQQLQPAIHHFFSSTRIATRQLDNMGNATSLSDEDNILGGADNNALHGKNCTVGTGGIECPGGGNKNEPEDNNDSLSDHDSQSGKGGDNNDNAQGCNQPNLAANHPGVVHPNENTMDWSSVHGVAGGVNNLGHNALNDTEDDTIDALGVEEDCTATGKFTGLLQASIAGINQQKMDQMLASTGQLWHSGKPDFVLSNTISVVDDSLWKHFVGYSVFNWRLEKLMCRGWKPNCVSCGSKSKVTMHSRTRDARLVYGVKSNYLLNSPEQWICDSCRCVNATEKANNIEAGKRTKYTFSSHHAQVLDALAREHPGIRSLFPCEIGWRSAIDKDLVDLITSAANSGMGPSSIQEFVKTCHYHHHQEAELRWLQFLADRIRNPTMTDSNLTENLKQLMPFPPYASDDVCGRLPSKSLLCDYYCRLTHNRTPRMDALHQRLVSTSKVFCIDASYKVPKWLALIFGEQMFSTLITMVDEDHIPLASYFAVSDNHDEIKSALEILQQLGWTPTCGFTDNVPRDKDFLLQNVESLCQTRNESLAPEDPSLLLLDDNDQDSNPNSGASVPTVVANENDDFLALRSPPQYCTCTESSITALNLFEEKLLALEDKQEKVISFDMEWSVFYDGTPPSETALVGFGSLCHNKVVMIHLAKIKSKKEVLNRIASLFRQNKDFLFVGFNIAGDMTKLRKDFPMVDFGKPVLRDLGWWCIYRGLLEHTKGGHTLDTASKVILKKTVPKMVHLRRSNVWTRSRKLGEDAKLYLARDVEGGIQIFNRTKDLPDLSIRLRRQDLRVGMEVDILPTRKTGLSPIAKGVVCQFAERNSQASSTCTGIPLTGNRVLVEITRVFKPNSGLYYTQVGRRKCKCGATSHKHQTNTQQCDLRTFGDAQRLKPDPFTIVEDCIRLRRSCNNDRADVEVIAEQRPSALHMDTRPILTLTGDVPTDTNDSASNLLGGELSEMTSSGINKDDNHLTMNLPQQAILDLDQLVQYQHGDSSTDDLDDGFDINGLAECDDVFATASSRQVAFALESQSVVERIIRDANELATSQNQNGSGMTQPLVLGDAFHFMDRVKVPVHHDWKAAYFSAFRDAIFIYDTDDKAKVQAVLESLGKTWERETAFNFRYITKRVRRYIPPCKVLHARVKAVFDFFCDKQDAKTGKTLFGGKDAMKKKDLVLEALLRGELSDPTEISLYVPEFYPGSNTPKRDKNGLHLWRCIRGTGPAENAHSQYTRAFGQVRAGPMYSCAVLRNHHHRKTIRAAMAHRPGFPQIYHFDIELVDAVDQFTFDIFGKSKYTNWPSYHEAVPIKRSPFGIIPLVEECGRGKHSQPCQYLSPQLQYLASCMDSDLPYTPIATREEKILFKTLLEGAIDERTTLNSSTFTELARKWNQEHVTIPRSPQDPFKIFPKYSRHLTIGYKIWRTQTSKTNRIKEARETAVLAALKLNPGIRVPGSCQPNIPDPVPTKKRQRRKEDQTPPTTVQETARLRIPQLIPPTQPPQLIPPTQPQHTIPFNNLLHPSAGYHFPSRHTFLHGNRRSSQEATRYPSQKTSIHPNYPQPPSTPLPQRQGRRAQICKECLRSVCKRPWNRSRKCNI